MAIELDFQIGVQGAEKLSSVDKIMQQIQGSTKLSAGELRVFEAALKSSGSSSESLKSTLQLVAKGGGDVSVAMSKAAKDVLAFAAAENQVAATATQASTAHAQLANSVRQMGSAHAKAVPEIAAASAAIRTFEGALPIRAVERFLVQVLNMGPILQAAFPVIGALAFAGVVVRIIDQVFEIAHGWDAVSQAQDRSLLKMRDYSKETDKLTQSIESRSFRMLELTSGRPASLSAQASAKEQDVTADRRMIYNTRNQIQKLHEIEQRGGKAGKAASVQAQDLSSRLLTYGLRETDDSGEAAMLRLQEKQAREEEAKAASRDSQRAAKQAESAAAKAAREQRERRAILQGLSGAGESPLARLSDKYQTDLANPLMAGRKSDVDKAYFAGYARELENAVNITKKKALELVSARESFNEEGIVLAEKILQSQGKQVAAGVTKAFRSTNGDPLVPKFLGTDPSEQIRVLNDQERRQSRAININSQISGPGNEMAAARQIRDLEIATQSERFKWELSIAKAKTDSVNAVHNAEIENARKLYDINAEYEDKLLEKKKTDQANFRSAVQGGFGALISGGGGGFSSFLKSQAVGMGSTIAGNAADMIYPSVQGAIGNKLNLDPNSLPGRLLKGTPFSADPTKDLLANSNKENTAATNANTTAMQSFNAQLATMLSPSGGGGSAGGGGSSLVFDENGNPTNYGGGGSTAMGLPSGSGGGAAGKVMAALGIGGAAYSGLSGVLSGLGSTGDVRGIATGISTIGGGATTLSNSERIGGAIGTAGVVVGGGFAAYNDFKKGGARGIIGGIGDLAGVAATLDPEPISKIVLASIAAGSQLIKGLFGDPKAERAHQIEKELGNAKYEEPISMNQTRDQNGNYVDSNRYGSLRQSPFSAVPVVQESSQRYRGGVYEQNPGGVVSPYSGGGSTVNVTINAIDSKSVADHAPAIFSGLAAGAAHGHGDGFIAAMNYGQGR